MTVAVIDGNISCESFLKDNFPEWNKVSFSGEEEGYQAVETGEADCVLLSNYRIAQTEQLRKRHNLTPVPTGQAVDFSFAVCRSNQELYLILNKLSGLVSKTSIDSSLLSYSWPDEGFSLTDFLLDHLAMVILTIVALAVLVVMLLERRAKQMKRELEERLALQNELLDKERHAGADQHHGHVPVCG